MIPRHQTELGFPLPYRYLCKVVAGLPSFLQVFHMLFSEYIKGDFKNIRKTGRKSRSPTTKPESCLMKGALNLEN